MNATSRFTTFGLNALLAVAAFAVTQLSSRDACAQYGDVPPMSYREYPTTAPPPRPTTHSSGVPWQGTPTSPLTSDRVGEPRLAAAREYYLARRPDAVRESEQELRRPSTQADNVFGPPPVPREYRGREYPDASTSDPRNYGGTTSPFPPPPPPPTPTRGLSGPPRERLPDYSDPRQDPRPPREPPQAPQRDPRYEFQREAPPRPTPPRPAPGSPLDTYPPSPMDTGPTYRGENREQFIETPPRPDSSFTPRENPGGTLPPTRPPAGRDGSFRPGEVVVDDRNAYPPGPVAPERPTRPDVSPTNWRDERPASRPEPPPATQPEPPSTTWRDHNPLETGRPTPPVAVAGANAGMFEPARVLYIVGDQPILAGDLLPQIEQMIRQAAAQIPPDQLEAQKTLALKALGQQAVQSKLAYLEFMRSVPADRIGMITETLDTQFAETQLEKAMQKAGVNSPAEYDAKLRKMGSSLEKQRRAFSEQVLAREMIRQNVKTDEEITHEEMLAYYREHLKDFYVPAKVRWEQLEVRFSRIPSKREARQTLAAMGNQVLGGAPLAEVARRGSHGFKASEGGQHDWTQKGSLKSKVVDEAIFTLPPNELSQIIESEGGLHIIRVLERLDETTVPFVEAQVKIKEKIKKERYRTQLATYLDKLRQQTPVWSVFDKPSSSVADAPTSEHRFAPR